MCDNEDLCGTGTPEKEDISDELIQTSEQIFNDNIVQDNALLIPNKKEIKTSDNPLTVNIPDNEWFGDYSKKLLGNSRTDIILEYHNNEIENATKTLRATLGVFTFVTLSTFVITAISVFLQNSSGAIITGALGTLIDAILGVAIKFLNATLQSKKSYFDAECESEKFRLMLMTLQTISDREKKDSVIEKVVSKYFKLDKNN